MPRRAGVMSKFVIKHMVLATGEVDFLAQEPAQGSKDFLTVPGKERAMKIPKQVAEGISAQMNGRFGNGSRRFEAEEA